MAYVGTEPGGLDSVTQNPEPRAQELQQHLVLQDTYIPTVLEDIKLTFQRLEESLKYAHALAKEGKVESLVLDNITFLSLNRWLYMEKYECKRTGSGEVDTRGMYGALALWMYRFILLNVVSFPGHVVICAHEQLESEEDQKSHLYANLPITPDVLGSMKYRVAGLVSASIYLNRRTLSPGKWSFEARCIEGAGKRAKNRYGLKEIVTDISYDSIIAEIRNGRQVGGASGPSAISPS